MTGTADLRDAAIVRARLAAVLGELLLTEPGPALSPLLAGVDSLAPLASGDPELAVLFERHLLRGVPLGEAAFLGDDAARAGPDLQARYARHDFDEVGRWRAAGADHLGLQLRFYAHLCAAEARGWGADRPDEATRAVDERRELLAAHLGTWAEVAMAALARQATGTPYAALAEAVADFVAAECELLRPAPAHARPRRAVTVPRRRGPARLARWLLSAGDSGVFLNADELGSIAARMGMSWRPSDTRSRFRFVVEGAADDGAMAELCALLVPHAQRWRHFHDGRVDAGDGNRGTWLQWSARTDATLALLDELATAAATSRAARAVVAVTGGTLAARVEAVRTLAASVRAADMTVAVIVDVDLESLGPLFGPAGPVDEVVLRAGTTWGAAWHDTGEGAEERTTGPVDVVVRIPLAAADRGPVQQRVESDPGGRLDLLNLA